MPQFRWRGVTIEGNWRSGRACALSAAQLEARMLTRGIAVTKVSSINQMHFLQPAASLLEQAHSLETLALLLDAGIRLQEACIVITEAVTNAKLQELWIECVELIEEGKTLEQSQWLTRFYNPLIAQLLLASYRAGTLNTTAHRCAAYARATYDLQRKLKNALYMPIITLLFVIMLLWLIFAFLVPSLTALFSQFNATLPVSTQILLTLSSYARNDWVLGGIGIALIFFYGMMRYASRHIYRCLLYMPFVGQLHLHWQRVIFVQSLYALLDGGIPLLEALQTIAGTAQSPSLRAYAEQIAHVIAGGMPLSTALATADLPLATPLMIAMVTVGQESNNLVSTLATFAEREMTQFLSRLNTLTLFLQPALIIILGFVVLAVIGAVYMPLLNIAQVVQ